MRHIERQNDLWTKNANNKFVSKIWEYWTNVHLRIVRLESGGLQLPVIKKTSLRKYFQLSKMLFLNIRFYPNTDCSIITHLHYPELKSRA